MFRFIPAVCLLLAVVDSRAAAAWRLGEAMGLPAWVKLEGEHRVRYESLDGQFRAGRTGGDQILNSRLSLKARVGSESLGVFGELLDSRQALADAGTPLNAGHVNALELLQGFAEVNWNGNRWRFGRQTMDLGGRRLVARNRFRNTINSFNGLEFRRLSEAKLELRAFYGLPLVRRPGDAVNLLANEAQLDREGFDLQFASLFVSVPELPLRSRGEFYLFGLYEEDSARRASRNRRLLTPGFRWFRQPAVGAVDFELESALQFGRSRSSAAATDVTDLNHLAHLQHAAVGYTFDASWKPRMVGQFDYVSGDGDPADGDNGRFDGLFGGNRFEHGPTGIFGEFGRVNILSPGWRLIVKPARGWNVMFAHRGYWLASARDGQGRSGLRDATGASGRFAGQQIETRIRWEALPGNLRVEAGAAHVFNGEFLRKAPRATGLGNSTYAYLQTMIWF